MQTFSVPTHLPVVVRDLSHLPEVLTLAQEAVGELRVSHPQTIASNVSAAYRSPWQSHRLNPKLMPLCQSVVAIAKEVSLSVLAVDLDDAPLKVGSCWVIVYEEGDQTRLHNHFPATFSCAVYLEADGHCAPIVFGESFELQPKAGTLVLFPGILNHAVPAHAGGKRVVVSMNLRLEWTA
jgi:hypothetical protein